MAVQTKLKSKGPLLIIIIGVILLIMCTILLCSCEEETPNVTQFKSITIYDSEKVKFKVEGGLSFVFVKFNYEGHEYFADPLNHNAFIMHSPNCPCLKETKVESSSLFDSSPSSLFSW